MGWLREDLRKNNGVPGEPQGVGRVEAGGIPLASGWKNGSSFCVSPKEEVMEIVPQAAPPRLTTCLFDLCAAVQASVRADEQDARAEEAVIDHLLHRAWWEAEEETPHAEAA